MIHITVRIYGDLDDLQTIAETICKDAPGLKVKSLLHARRTIFFEAETHEQVIAVRNSKYCESVMTPGYNY